MSFLNGNSNFLTKYNEMQFQTHFDMNFKFECRIAV